MYAVGHLRTEHLPAPCKDCGSHRRLQPGNGMPLPISLYDMGCGQEGLGSLRL